MSPVESYLDTLFDQLAGTGAAGRRMLADAEAHLLESVAAGRARGLAELDAERDAIARFGPADAVTRRVGVPAGNVGVAVRRVLIGMWALASVGLLWYGLSGLVTWLVGWPWTRLIPLAARSPCRDGGIPAECLHASLDMVPAGGDRFPYPFVALLGALLLVALLVLRRTTRLGTPSWTLPRTSASLAFAVPFGAVGGLLVLYGVLPLLDGDYDRLSYLVAGLLAVAVTAGAVRWRMVGRPRTELLGTQTRTSAR